MTSGGGQQVTRRHRSQDLGRDADAPAEVSFETPLAGQWPGDAHGSWTTAGGGLPWTGAAFR